MSTSATTTEAPSEMSSRNCQTTSLCNVWLESQDSTTLSSRRYRSPSDPSSPPPSSKPSDQYSTAPKTFFTSESEAQTLSQSVGSRSIDDPTQTPQRAISPWPLSAEFPMTAWNCTSTPPWVPKSTFSAAKSAARVQPRFGFLTAGSTSGSVVPNMPTARKQGLRTIVLDAKIYVFGSLTSEGSWADMFDTVAGRWEAIPSPELTVYDKLVLGCGIRDGKVGVWVEGEELRFDPVSKTWEVFSLVMPEFSHICEVSGVLCCCDVYIKEFKGLDERVGLWKEIKLVNGGFPNDFMMLQTLNVGGRSVIVGLGRIGICCAEFEVKQDRDNGDFFGEVLWSDMVYSMHKSLLYRLSLFNTCMPVSL